MANSFISFDNTTGLNVKTKADIFQDLINITKVSYGQEFVVVPGTEMYSFLDNLAYALAETGSATKSVYDSFSFLTATGTPLDVLCSLAGISRKEGETDTQLRNRYYKFLFTPATSTVRSLETKLLDLTYNDGTAVYNLIDVVKVLNNDTSLAVTQQGVEVPAHGIAVICGLNTQIFDNEAIAVDVKRTLVNEISTTIENYKTLGCAVYEPTDLTQDYFKQVMVRFMPTQEFDISIELNITFQVELWEDEKNAIITTIKQNIYNYINNLSIGNDIFYSGIMACVYNMYRQLGYTEDLLNIGSITCSYKLAESDISTILSPENALSVYVFQKPTIKREDINVIEVVI